MIVALSLSALVGIYLFLAGSFSEEEITLLFTTLTIGLFSLTGLCSSVIYKKKEFRIFSIIGMAISVVDFLIAVIAIWEIIDFDDMIGKALIISIITAVALGHISLLLLINPNSYIIKVVLAVTIVFISILALMLIESTINEFDEDEFFFRLVGVFSILDVLGTIITPVLNKVAGGEK